MSFNAGLSGGPENAASDDAPVWSIFCRVVDNFGDIGVCWRLARTLAVHHGCDVRLWIDQPEAMSGLCPAMREQRLPACVDGVTINAWEAYQPDGRDVVVVEAFACELPESCLEAMARAPRAVCWINLEYLSAEAWVDDCHGLPSPHPRLALTKHFFFPGFTPATGGLLREPGLLAQRDAWRGDTLRQADFLAALGGVVEHGAFKVSLFAYEQPGLRTLLRCWAEGTQNMVVFVPEGRVLPDIAAFFDTTVPVAGSVLRRGALEVRVLPFLSHDDYDRLLWSCDLNFVRGEDSLVRAQWAARPFVWHIYPQQDAAHRVKLEAFLARFTAVMEAPLRDAVADMWRAWNGEGDLAQAWSAWCAAQERIAVLCREWSVALATRDDLTTALVKFSESRVK